VERLRLGKTAEERSGVVWHTQGSGKSLTMVFVARMLRASADLSDFKIVMVNDRIDLEEQLAATARLIGGKVNVIESTAQLRAHLSTDASDVNMVMVHKFMERMEEVPLMVAETLARYGKPPKAETFGVINRSERILLMIDEAHRTQSSDLGDNLFEAFPNATRIAFTGTPLITEQHGNKRTVKRFGDYIDNILPDGFKAQVVCHSKLAAVRYKKAIRAALAERIDREKVRPRQDEALIRHISFLKAVTVLSADATNELAVITEARKEAKRWNAVENFCKPFDFDDPAKDLTGIAFLIVCDMLLTGFDAPVEQVMYIDKRLREHNLLQAIARVNRVAPGKHRGFIVDYIGLANHLSYALSIYAAEDAQDIQQGLKNLLTELPIHEERYQRLLQHFRSVGVTEIEAFVTGALATTESEVAVVHEAVGAMKDIKRRADFEVYLKKFLQSLNLILPHEAGHPYRGPARRFGYLVRMVKERYKDDSLDLADAGAKVKALINEHLIDLGINPKILPIELLSDDFMANVRKHAAGDPQAKASEMEHAIRKHCTVHFDEDPAFYKRLSDKLEKLIQEHKDNWEALSEAYEQLREEALAGRKDVAEGLTKETTTFYDYVLQLAFDGRDAAVEYRQPLKNLMIRIVELLQETIDIIDFWRKPIEVKKLRGNIDTEILLSNIPPLAERHERIAVEIVKLAEKRHKDLTA
jgi:type I restriction enzyme, R subunit